MDFKERDRWIRHFCKDVDLTPAHKLLGVRLAHSIRVETGQVQMRAACLADACGVSERTVITALTAIVEAGWLKRQRGSGKYDVYTYELIDRGEDFSPSGVKTLHPSGVKTLHPRGEDFSSKNLSEGKISESLTGAARRSENSSPLEPSSERDWESSDGSVFFRAREIYEMADDLPAIDDIRGQIRQAFRWAEAEGVPRARRKSAMLSYLRNHNEKVKLARETKAAKAAAEANGVKKKKLIEGVDYF
jgi:hypothetical protein